MSRSILFVAIGFVVVFCIRCTLGTVCMPSEFLLSADVSISSDTVAMLHNQLREYTEKKSSLHDVVTECKKQCPYIKEISMRYKPRRSAITVTAYSPLCIINEEYVLIENNDVIKKNFFTVSVTDGLPYLEINDECKVDSAALAKVVLRALPTDIYHDYHVTIQDKNSIVLTDKNNKCFSIVCSAEQIISQELLSHCQTVRENVLTASATLDTKSKWIADTRFADYIVAYKA